MNLQVLPPLKNPESTVGAAFVQFRTRFAAVLVLGLLLSAAPRLLLLFLDNIPQLPRIDLLPWLTARVQLPDETLAAQYQEMIDEYAQMGVFSISPVYLALSALISLFVTPLMNGCAALLTLDGFFGSDRDAVTLLTDGAGRYGRWIAATVCGMLLSALILLASAVPLVLAVLFTGTKLGAGLLGMLAWMCAMVLWIWAMLGVSALQGMVPAVAAAEDLRGFRAALRAWKLVRTHFWRCGFSMFLMTLLVGYAAMALQTLLVSASVYLAAAAAALVGGVLSLLLPITGTRCYIAARSRLERLQMLKTMAAESPLPDVRV